MKKETRLYVRYEKFAKIRDYLLLLLMMLLILTMAMMVISQL